jgi:pilus assembly protein Flp/PilA
MKRARRKLTDRGQRGQGMVEYALILVLVAVVVVTVLTTLGTRITAAFTNVINALGG